MMKKDKVLPILKNSLIVSCQSEGADPFNAKPEYMALFAKAAEMGGAMGIRAQGIETISLIKNNVNIPVIGLVKTFFNDGTVKITGSFSEVEQLIEIGVDIIAIDGTFRHREGLNGPEFIKAVKQKYDCIVLADIATYDEAIACKNAGADCISTTLNGYTLDTFNCNENPNYELLKKIILNVDIPVFAEGRYNTPLEAKTAIELGAYGVVTGTAITRPRVITSWFVNAINN